VPDGAESLKPGNGTSQTGEEQESSPESVPDIIKRYRLTFADMANKLEFGQAIEASGEMKELVRDDISNYLKDIIQFSTYVRRWEATIPNISESFNSMEGIHDKLQKAGNELNVALKLDTRLRKAGSDIAQLEGAYSTCLTNCSNFIRQMLDECFKKE
jgi:predicted DNA-binding protein YlxM (UPF0122 family)